MYNMLTHHNTADQYLDGAESPVPWSCIVSSPSLLKASPAAANISPTYKQIEAILT